MFNIGGKREGVLVYWCISVLVYWCIAINIKIKNKKHVTKNKKLGNLKT